jgi:hypothetical protein
MSYLEAVIRIAHIAKFDDNVEISGSTDVF